MKRLLLYWLVVDAIALFLALVIWVVQKLGGDG